MKKLCSSVLAVMTLLGIFGGTAFATNVRPSLVFSGTSNLRAQISVSSSATHGVNGLRAQAQNITTGQRSAVAERSRSTNIPSSGSALQSATVSVATRQTGRGVFSYRRQGTTNWRNVDSMDFPR